MFSLGRDGGRGRNGRLQRHGVQNLDLYIYFQILGNEIKLNVNMTEFELIDEFRPFEPAVAMFFPYWELIILLWVTRRN